MERFTILAEKTIASHFEGFIVANHFCDQFEFFSRSLFKVNDDSSGQSTIPNNAVSSANNNGIDSRPSVISLI
jgi:hypothetical protein